MDRTSDQLKLELIKRNITIPSSGTGRGKALSRKDMVNLLAKHHYAKLEKPSWGLTQRLKYESPAVCFTFKNLKEEEKKHIQDSEDWVAETKWDGCRIWICYHPAEGFTFFSRNISVEDFLPVDYTDTILIIKDGKVSKPSDYIGRYKQSFILDSECVTDCKDLDTSLGLTKKGVITGTELNAVSALLALNPADSHQLQMTKAPLRFQGIDILEIGDHELWKMTLKNRRPFYDKVQQRITPDGFPISEISWVYGKDKEAFYLSETKSGREGVIYKNLQASYQPVDNRNRHSAFIKRKRSVAESLGGDIDAFITGFVPPDPARGWSDFIGALEMSVILLNEDGTETEHCIASISGIPMLERQKMSITGVDGKPALNPEYLGKVLVINGQDVSPKALKFMHASCDWSRGFRNDKSSFECTMAREFLMSQVL